MSHGDLGKLPLLPLASGIITLTKQTQQVDKAAPQGAGAPESTSCGSSSQPLVSRERREAGALVIQGLHGVVDSYCLAEAVYTAMAAVSDREAIPDSGQVPRLYKKGEGK